MALSARASSAITSAWVTKSVPSPPYSFGTAMVRNPSFEPFLTMLPVEGFVRGRNFVARERDRADFLVGELARRHLPVALLVAQCEVHEDILVCMESYSAATAAIDGRR